MKQEVVIDYRGNLPSVNHMYGRNKWGSTYLKAEGKALKQEIFFKVPDKLPRDVEIGYELVIRGNWYNSSKSAKTRIKKRDSNNLIKLIIDACCEAIDVDDSQIFEERVIKQQSNNPGFSARFYVISKSDLTKTWK